MLINHKAQAINYWNASFDLLKFWNLKCFSATGSAECLRGFPKLEMQALLTATLRRIFFWKVKLNTIQLDLGIFQKEKKVTDVT